MTKNHEIDDSSTLSTVFGYQKPFIFRSFEEKWGRKPLKIEKWRVPVSVLQWRRRKVTAPDFKLEDGVPRVDFGDPSKTEMVPKSIFSWSVGTAGL